MAAYYNEIDPFAALRAYGNAIVAPVTEAFITAYLDARDDR